MAITAPAPRSYSELKRALQVTRRENKQAREAFAHAASFAGIEGDLLFTGSAYVGLKVKSATEFDVMVVKKDWRPEELRRRGFVVQWPIPALPSSPASRKTPMRTAMHSTGAWRAKDGR